MYKISQKKEISIHYSTALTIPACRPAQTCFLFVRKLTFPYCLKFSFNSSSLQPCSVSLNFHVVVFSEKLTHGHCPQKGQICWQLQCLQHTPLLGTEVAGTVK